MDHIDDEMSDRMDQYLRGEMSPAERSAFEGGIAENPALQAALAERRDLVRGIREAVEADFRLVVERELADFERVERRERMHRLKKTGLWLAVGVLTVVGLWLGWLYFFRPEQLPVQRDNPPHIPMDTTISNPVPADTVPIQKKEEDGPVKRPKPTGETKSGQKNQSNTPASPPVAAVQKHPSDSSTTTPTLAAITELPVRRVIVSDGQKTGEELLPVIPLKVLTDDAMKYAFYVKKLRLYVPGKFAEGQQTEIVQLRGTGDTDGYYLKVGQQVYRMENERGNPFPLEPISEARVLRLLLE